MFEGGDTESMKASIDFVKREWVKGLSGIKSSDIEKGIDKVRNMRNWWPDIVEFVGFCLRLPSEKECTNLVISVAENLISISEVDLCTRRVINRMGGEKMIGTYPEQKIKGLVATFYDNEYERSSKTLRGLEVPSRPSERYIDKIAGVRPSWLSVCSYFDRLTENDRKNAEQQFKTWLGGMSAVIFKLYQEKGRNYPMVKSHFYTFFYIFFRKRDFPNDQVWFCKPNLGG